MHFEVEPPGKDDYNSDIRQALGVEDDELLILQPTRVVQRKGIEHALEMVSRLERKAAFVISHASGDEGFEYEKRVRDYALLLNVRAILWMILSWIREEPPKTAAKFIRCRTFTPMLIL